MVKDKSGYNHKKIEGKWPHFAKATRGKPHYAIASRGRQDVYDHRKIEKYWQDVWEKEGIFYPDLKKDKNPYFNLWMFPYPSAEGLHVGHAFTSTGGDIHGRYMRMQGKSVFQPTGYDSFGIHSENYALKIGETPYDVIARTTRHYEEQLRSLGHGYDWTRTVTTSDIDYYRWTEWVFTTLFKAGLAYRKKQKVNFCPSCKTVLADEQVMTPKQAGKEPKDAEGNIVRGEDLRVCERCGTVVEDKELEQWSFRITDYADRLLNNLEKITWTEKVKIAQKEWIGKSKGLSIDFTLLTGSNPVKVAVWTKFWETVYGVTFLVVAPEYVEANLKKFIPEENKSSVSLYIKKALNKSDVERREEKEKSGVNTGLVAVNPVNQRKVPVFVADYVLADVGTGAVMGVPAHDERDFEFAKKYKLPVIRVVSPKVDYYRSYLMGGKNISDKELEDLGINIIGKGESGRKIEIPRKSISKYENLIQDKLEKGFWNEYVGDRICFIFKDTEGKTETFILDLENERNVSEKSSKYAKVPLNEDYAWSWLADVDIYKDLIVHESGGRIENSGKFNGLDAWGEGKEKMAEWMVKKGFGHWETNYHLRDWLISRQRYWGCPIPMIYCEKCAKEGRSFFSENKFLQDPLKSSKGLLHDDQSDWDSAGWFPVPDKDLPVVLPKIKDWEPEGTGKGPLANHPDYYNVTCPECGQEAKRETDVADTFLDSSWYFLAYPNVNTNEWKKGPMSSSENGFFDKEITKKWLPVDLYFGGAEHAVLHLMYARFITMVLNDLSYLTFDEPFPRFKANGLVIKDGAKMSKSRGNVINPDTYVQKFGADTLRMYLMFMGPIDGYPDFRDTGIEGMGRFMSRLWKVFINLDEAAKEDNDLTIKMHQTIKKVSIDLEEFSYNTVIAAIMEFVNAIKEKKNYAPAYLEVLVKLIAPLAPHLAEEVWIEKMNHKTSIHLSKWPTYDEKLTLENMVTISIQVNGKLRGTARLSLIDAGDKEKVVKTAKVQENVSKWLEGKKVVKEIFVPGKIVNFVVK